jgi:hypothetical protein
VDQEKLERGTSRLTRGHTWYVGWGQGDSRLPWGINAVSTRGACISQGGKEEKGQLGWENMNKLSASSWCPRVGVYDVTDVMVDYGYVLAWPKGNQWGAETCG